MWERESPWRSQRGPAWRSEARVWLLASSLEASNRLRPGGQVRRRNPQCGSMCVRTLYRALGIMLLYLDSQGHSMEQPSHPIPHPKICKGPGLPPEVPCPESADPRSCTYQRNAPRTNLSTMPSNLSAEYDRISVVGSAPAKLALDRPRVQRLPASNVG